MAAATLMGIAAVASAMSVATIAAAAPQATGRTGLFATWRGAQRAAGFGLMKPTKTFGLTKASDIIVARCEISRKMASKRIVIGQYATTAPRSLTISQNNSNGPCTHLRSSKALGTYQIDGVNAYLTGDCDAKGLPSCSLTKIFLFLTWRTDGIYCQVSSFGEPASVLLSFARGLVRV
jgi:hypothetical protein